MEEGFVDVVWQGVGGVPMTIFIAKCNLAFCQAEFPFPVRLYSKIILYGVVYPPMYTCGYVHVHVCVCVDMHAHTLMRHYSHIHFMESLKKPY